LDQGLSRVRRISRSGHGVAKYQSTVEEHRWTFPRSSKTSRPRPAETAATVQAAAAEDRDQLKQRIDQAQDAADQTMQDAKQQVEQAADRAESKWRK
jgi:DNA-binding transcriptional MerR regulator